jgi:hypothetical protein
MERGDRTNNSSFKRGWKQPIVEVEKKERKTLNLKKGLTIIFEKEKKISSDS